MSFTVFLQVFLNVVFITAIFVIFARLRRPAKDDPRLSKGLQLLSSKIAVLEDLNDRTETQVQQMLVLLDQKSRELQSKILLAEQQVQAVRQSMDQSLEVAQIFQDKIPHTEIIERQNSVKYIRAARLAHAGSTPEEIAREVDLPMGEIEFIAKVNQENLSFREEELPAWAREPQSAATNEAGAMPGEFGRATQIAIPATSNSHATPMTPVVTPSTHETELVEQLNRLQFEMKSLDMELANRSGYAAAPARPNRDFSQAFETPQIETSSLARIGEEFRRAVEAAEQTPTFTTPKTPQFTATPAPTTPPQAAATSAPTATATATATANAELEAARAAAMALRTKDSVQRAEPGQVRRVEFPRI